MKLVSLVLLVQLSTCIEPDRMVRYFEYHCLPNEAYDESKHILETLEYEIEFATRTEGIITTNFRNVTKDIRRYDYAVAILIKDVIEVYIIGKKNIFRRSSETTIGGDILTGAQVSDTLPHSIQTQIFHDIELGMRLKGYKPFHRSQKNIP